MDGAGRALKFEKASDRGLVKIQMEGFEARKEVSSPVFFVAKDRNIAQSLQNSREEAGLGHSKLDFLPDFIAVHLPGIPRRASLERQNPPHCLRCSRAASARCWHLRANPKQASRAAQVAARCVVQRVSLENARSCFGTQVPKPFAEGSKSPHSKFDFNLALSAARHRRSITDSADGSPPSCLPGDSNPVAKGAARRHNREPSAQLPP